MSAACAEPRGPLRPSDRSPPAREPPAVTLDRVEVRRAGKKVLAGVCAHIAQGTFAGVVGPNGGGKTTLLQVILGVVRPLAGSVRVLGADPAAAPTVRRRIGYLPQLPRHDLLFPVSALDVVEMGALARLGGMPPQCRTGRGADRRVPRGAGRRLARNLALDALCLVGLGPLAETVFGRLSGGQRQLVLLARAVVGNPRLLLLDEPLTGLDQQRRAEFYPLVDRIRNETGLTVLAVCHDFRNLMAHADRLLCLDGALHEHWQPGARLSGPPGPEFAERCLYEAVFGRPPAEHRPPHGPEGP